jgi:hypothetical protein
MSMSRSPDRGAQRIFPRLYQPLSSQSLQEPEPLQAGQLGSVLYSRPELARSCFSQCSKLHASLQKFQLVAVPPQFRHSVVQSSSSALDVLPERPTVFSPSLGNGAACKPRSGHVLACQHSRGTAGYPSPVRPDPFRGASAPSSVRGGDAIKSAGVGTRRPRFVNENTDLSSNWFGPPYRYGPALGSEVALAAAREWWGLPDGRGTVATAVMSRMRTSPTYLRCVRRSRSLATTTRSAISSTLWVGCLSGQSLKLCGRHPRFLKVKRRRSCGGPRRCVRCNGCRS